MDHTEAPRAPVIQFGGARGVLDLGWGHPDPALLPVDEWAAATAAALRAAGWTALTYRYATGPGPLLEWLAVHTDRSTAGRRLRRKSSSPRARRRGSTWCVRC